MFTIHFKSHKLQTSPKAVWSEKHLGLVVNITRCSSLQTHICLADGTEWMAHGSEGALSCIFLTNTGLPGMSAQGPRLLHLRSVLCFCAGALLVFVLLIESKKSL